MNDKRIKLDNSIRLKEKIAQTNISELYKATIDTDEISHDGLYYAVKFLKNRARNIGMSLTKEMEVTHQIENNSSQSIVIPILMNTEVDGQLCSIMQFKNNGMFLNSLLDQLRNRYSKEEALECYLILTKKILDALQCLHHCLPDGGGYLHLDIHPGNIFVENVNIEKKEFGSVKFIDFQSALFINNEGVVQKNRKILSATKVYSAPEVTYNFASQLTYATDLYSVGAILYFMLFGEEYEGYIDSEEYGDSYPFLIQEQLDLMLMCCLDKNSKYRYGTAEEIAVRIERIYDCWNAYVRKDYYGLFAAAYTGWIPQKKALEMSVEFSKEMFLKSVLKLAEDLTERTNDRARMDYIFNGLWSIKESQYKDIQAEQLDQTDITIHSSLISSGISISNHMGNNIRATQLFEELIKYKENIQLMEYLEILNRVAVMYCDCYEYQKAYDLTKSNIEALEDIKQAYENVAKKAGFYQDKTSYVKALGKAYSAMGSYMTWLHMEGATEYYEKALKEFEDDKKEREMTLSRYLHYAVHIKDRQLYQRLMKEYFPECDSAEARYEYAKKLALGIDLENGRRDMFHLWIWLKGLLYLYEEELNGPLADRVVEDFTSGLYDNIKSYIMMFLYRYIGIVLYKRNGNVVDEFADTAFSYAETCYEDAEMDFDKPLNMLICIKFDTERIRNDLQGNQELNGALVKALYSQARNSGWNILEKKLENKDSLKEVFELEYC